MASFLRKLGLRTPSESTAQTLTALAFHLPGADSAGSSNSPSTLHESFLGVKALLCRHCQQAPTVDGAPYVLDPDAVKVWAMTAPMRRKQAALKAEQQSAQAPMNEAALKLLLSGLPELPAFVYFPAASRTGSARRSRTA